MKGNRDLPIASMKWNGAENLNAVSERTVSAHWYNKY